MPRPKRRDAEIAHTRRHIVDAAARVFARRGVSGATVQEIALEAGFSPASLYGYFAGKQAIVRALVHSLHDESEAILRGPLPASLSFRQRVETILLRQTAWFEERFHDFLVFAREESLRLMFEEGEPGPPPHMASLSAWIEANGTPEDRGGVSSEDAAYLLWGVTRAFFVRWIYAPAPGDSPSGLAATIARYFFHGLLGLPGVRGEEQQR